MSEEASSMRARPNKDEIAEEMEDLSKAPPGYLQATKNSLRRKQSK